MVYKVEVTEVLSRIVGIEADSEEEAIENARELYYNEELILDYNDLQSEEFNIV